MLLSALNRFCSRDLHAKTFVLRVFCVTSGGISGELRKTHREIADCSEFGLCCGITKAKQTIRKVYELGFVTIDEHRYKTGGQDANEYRIDWDGVKRLLANNAPPPGKAGASRLPPVASRLPPVATRQPYKEYLTSSVPSIPEPVPEDRTGTDVYPGRGEDPVWTDPWLDLPVLVQAREQVITPMGPTISGSVLRAIQSADLKPASLVRWFRRQLDHPAPVLAGTEAHLLLALAAAVFVVESKDVRTSPVRWFNSIVSRRDWRKVLHRIDTAENVMQVPEIRQLAGLTPKAFSCHNADIPPISATDERTTGRQPTPVTQGGVS